MQSKGKNQHMRENNNDSETWTRLEKLKYIAFIMTHE
jgi:hypothetical protein